MHLKSVTFYPEKYPTKKYYPFNLDIFRQSRKIELKTAVTFFIGENGAGKSTLLQAMTQKCGVHIWQETDRPRFENNPYEKLLHKAIDVEWRDGSVPGSFFASQIFQSFSRILDEWAIADPRFLNRFGGKSLMTQSHGQSLMSYFKNRYKIKGIYFLDEPETALSPASQLELLNLITEMGNAGHAQFVIATHSPILLACPVAQIYSFNEVPIRIVNYEDTEYYTFYREFMSDYKKFISDIKERET